MIQSFFTGLSGMFSFSQNLNNVSNNISNMNTPGFKGSDTFYQSLTTENGGYGTKVELGQHRMSAGEIRQTGNEGDLAISGKGFFVLMQEGEIKYSRAGQFSFDNDGFLIEPISGAKIAGVNESGQLEEIDLSNYRILAPQASTTINFEGNLSLDENVQEITDINVFDDLGKTHALSFEFTDNSVVTDGSWLVVVKDDLNNVIHNGEIRFDASGTPETNFNSLSFDITNSKSDLTNINVNFGDNGNFSNTTSLTGIESLNANVVDGYGIATISDIGFNEVGVVNITYSNGKVIDGPTLALASFGNESALSIDSGSIFKALDITSRTLSQAGSDGMGTIISESLELSNVDLSREFADMIIIQRGYQASSRILSVSNQLLEQLYESTRGR
jgi:flagellar hook protein FlgE